MLPRGLFLSLFFTLISCPLNPLAYVLEQTPGYEDRSDDFEVSFAELKMDYHDEIGDSMGYDVLGTPATGRGEVNVDDFGAEGDGKTDDTVVRTMNNGYSN